jgi:di/tricarboxylate transporter
MTLLATEMLRVDLVALLIIAALITSGVITPYEGVQGFSNTATITVAFMFALSAAMLKTGALQFVAHKLSVLFEKNFYLGMGLMMGMIAVISAFINNTPVVAVFIPVIFQIANTAGLDPKKMLIPLSFASIFGGTCTLIGTSTNILVSGIAEKEGLAPISMFQLSPIGLIFLAAGISYMLLFGIRILPKKGTEEMSSMTSDQEGDLDNRISVKNYFTEIELLEKIAPKDDQIRVSVLSEMGVKVLEVRRETQTYTLPSNNLELLEGDTVKVKCDTEKIKKLKNWAENKEKFTVRIGEENLEVKDSSLVELIILTHSPLDGQTLGKVDFLGRYKADPLGVKHRHGLMNENLKDVQLRAGDIVLAEVQNNYIERLQEMENEPQASFAILSKDKIISFDQKNFLKVSAVLLAVITMASFNILHIMTGTILGVSLLILLGILTMKELYKSIDWKVVFLLAGALSLGLAMNKTALDALVAEFIVDNLEIWGPIAIVSGLYLLTSIFTELITNNAAAALLAPIAIATADSLNLSPVPFLMAIAFAGSASFMTPIGYQTNTMVYSAGKYKFMDFVKVGTVLNILFWIIATFMIPLIYGF